MENRNKANHAIIASIIIAVIVIAGVVIYFVAFAPKPLEETGQGHGFQITEIRDYEDLVNIVSHIKYRLTSHEEGETSIVTITFDDLGDDTVDGYLCRKFSISIISDDDTQEITAWILKSDWTTLKKLMFNGELVPEEYLPYYDYIESLVLWPFATFNAWNIYWEQVPPAIGNLKYMGSENRVYGEITLAINKWRFTPNPAYEPLEDISKIDLWQGQVGSYHLFTYLDATEKDGDYFRFELLELTL